MQCEVSTFCVFGHEAFPVVTGNGCAGAELVAGTEGDARVNFAAFYDGDRVAK